jgi:hypothetical protein
MSSAVDPSEAHTTKNKEKCENAIKDQAISAVWGRLDTSYVMRVDCGVQVKR